MNEKIQGFAAIAKEKVPKGLPVDLWIQTYNIELAKLVILECANIANHPAPGCSTCFGDIIKQRFGIE